MNKHFLLEKSISLKTEILWQLGHASKLFHGKKKIITRVCYSNYISHGTCCKAVVIKMGNDAPKNKVTIFEL